MWLVCETCAKILLSDPETSLMTLRLLPLRGLRRSYGNYQSPQSSGSSRNILKRLGQSGRSGRSYGNQALTEKGSTILCGHLSHANFVWSRESNLRPLPCSQALFWLSKFSRTYMYFCPIQVSSLDSKHCEFVRIHQKPLRDVAFSCRGDGLLLTAGMDKTVRVTSMLSNAVVQT